MVIENFPLGNDRQIDKNRGNNKKSNEDITVILAIITIHHIV